MKKLSRGENLRAIMTLALPIILEEILSTLLQYVDTAMVGQLGPQATASISLTSTVNWLIGSLFSALGVAVVAVISSAYGAGDEERIKKGSACAFLLSLGGGIIITTITLSLSSRIPLWMNASEEIIRPAGEYFFIISLALPFRAFSVIEASAMRAIKDTRTPMVINLMQNFLNIILNYLMIYSLGWGTRGAATATLISYSVGGILMALLAVRKKELRFRKRDLRKQNGMLKELLSIAFPVAATSTTSCLGHIVFASLVSSMGTIVFAAHSIALSAETIFYVPGYGLRGATSTLIGISVGEGDRKKFKEIESLSVILTLAMMAFTGLLLYLFAHPIMRVFTPDEEVMAMGARVLRLIAFSEPIFGLMIVTEGVCYGLGDTKFPFWIETIGAWGIRILFTIIGLRLFNIDLFGVWICMLLDNSFRAFALAIPVLGGRDLRFFDKRRKAIVGNSR